MEDSTLGVALAVQDFHLARRRANLERLLARLTGRSSELLSYQEVRKSLRIESMGGRELREIPVEAIIGSVDRYQDFTRSFLPRRDDMENRWARVKSVADTSLGWPPIDVYQVGEVYFVQDGNHRVSVARQMGMPAIQAYVTEVKTRVPLTTDARPDDLICKALYADFLENTRLDNARPEALLEVTAGGAYQALEEHIRTHRYFMGLEQNREIPISEAAGHWYDNVYLPVVGLIRSRGVLREFPGRTETDLYLWLMDHRAELEESLGWAVTPEEAMEDLKSRHGLRPARRLDRVGRRVVDALLPDELEPGPEPGEWRRERLQSRNPGQLFQDVMVLFPDLERGLAVLDQALVIGQREGSRLLGLHVTSDEADAPSGAREAMQEAFEARCREAGLEGSFTVRPGPIARTASDLARFSDLVVLKLDHPPGETVRSRLESGLRTLIMHCPRPILAIPQAGTPLQRLLLAYDGSPKSEEALYLAASLAESWDSALVVLTVDAKEAAAGPLERAAAYLGGLGIDYTPVQLTGDSAERILAAADIYQCDTILLGGYGARPVVEVVLGSTADRVLRETDRAVFICQ